MTVGFVSRSTFACPLVKSFLETGHSVADLTPEDIAIVAAMGDSLAVWFVFLYVHDLNSLYTHETWRKKWYSET